MPVDLSAVLTRKRMAQEEFRVLLLVWGWRKQGDSLDHAAPSWVGLVDPVLVVRRSGIGSPGPSAVVAGRWRQGAWESLGPVDRACGTLAVVRPIGLVISAGMGMGWLLSRRYRQLQESIGCVRYQGLRVKWVVMSRWGGRVERFGL